MNSAMSTSDERKIYFARKAVHTYRSFKAKYVRATELINAYLGCDDTFPPMVRVISLKGWRKYKKLVVLLVRWIDKDGVKKMSQPEVLNSCIAVLVIMLNDEEKKRDRASSLLTRLEILENISLRKGKEQKPASLSS